MTTAIFSAAPVNDTGFERLLSADLSPTVDGFDGKATPDGAIPLTATNTGTGATAITVTTTWIRTE